MKLVSRRPTFNTGGVAGNNKIIHQAYTINFKWTLIEKSGFAQLPNNQRTYVDFLKTSQL